MIITSCKAFRDANVSFGPTPLQDILGQPALLKGILGIHDMRKKEVASLLGGDPAGEQLFQPRADRAIASRRSSTNSSIVCFPDNSMIQ